MIKIPKNIPATTGIYIFKKNNKVLYIGKSINILARVKSHFENAKISTKEARIVYDSNKIKCIITDSDLKAILLESKLIQKNKPKYNVVWKDDKSYLYIKITIKDKYPKIFIVRKENDKKSRYFGPFSSYKTLYELLREIRKVFPYCAQKKISKKACFYSKIKLCNPCPSNIEKEKNIKLIKEFKRIYKKQIMQIIRILEGKTDFVLKGLYIKLKILSKNKNTYEQALVLRNKIDRFEKLINQSLVKFDDVLSYNESEKALKELIIILNKYLVKVKSLKRIECYDISSTGQKDAAASMVVLINGLINKSKYKRFKIKNLNLKSDIEMIKEVIKRRIKYKYKPNLIVIDGGKPQVRIVQYVLKNAKINIPVIGIAKHPDRLIMGNKYFPIIRPDINNLGFNLIRLLRDESHRFAKKYHIFLRSKKMI